MKRWRVIAPILACLLVASAARAEWMPADLPYGDDLSEPVTSICAPGASDVWAVTTYSYPYQDDQHVRWNSLVYHSINDGLLWDLPFDAPSSQTDPTPNQYPFQDTQLFAVAFADRDNGWLFGWRKPAFGLTDPPGAYVFYHTTDRGHTWTISTLPNADAVPPDEPDFALDAQDATHCYAVQGRHVFETTDGAKWSEQAGAYPRLFSIQANGLIAPRVAGAEASAGVGGHLGPAGFSQDVIAPGAFHATRFRDPNTGWVAGGDATAGRVMGTTNGGGQWTTQLTQPDTLFRGLAVAGASDAWAVGQTTGATPSGVIYHTADGGATWAFDAATPGRLFSVAFRDAQHGWAAGSGGVWRYVPSVPRLTGDVDRNGETDVQDIVAILRRVAGIEVVSPSDPAALPVTLGDAIAAAQAQAHRPLDPRDRVPANLVIVYNTLSADSDGDGVGDSLQVARYYALRRGIPAENLVPISWHDAEAFQDHGIGDGGGRANWTDAYNAVVRPLQTRISALGRSNIYTILFCTGVPYRFNAANVDGTWDTIPLDTAVSDIFRTDTENWASGSPYFAPLRGSTERYGRVRFQFGARPIGQPVVGPRGSTVRDPYYLVSRLDGPSLEGCLAMVDNAIFAETCRGQGGYDGIAYIDTRAEHFIGAPYSLTDLHAFTPSFTQYAGVDQSIARSILTFSDRGLPWKDEVTYAQIGDVASAEGPRWRDGTPAASASGAMFYAGWYNYGSYNNVWDWLPGSVGIDFDSASAYGFRGSSYFAAGALGNGLTALVGVLGEPYNYHPKPDALMEYLARGFTFAEAAMLSTETPRTAKALFLGDPLYRPFRGLGIASPVPKPSLFISSRSTASSRLVLVEANVPVRCTLRYSTTGVDPVAGDPLAPGLPGFYARRHTFRLPPVGTVRYQVFATDVIGRTTMYPVATLP